MMICWDAAHRRLWRQYAGKIDLMVISSCPPDVTNPAFLFPDGDQVTLADLGPVGRQLAGSGERLFGEMVNQQTAWLGVPTVQTVGSGHLRTGLPNGRLTMAAFAPAAPQLLRRLRQGDAVQMSCDFIPGCKVVDHRGHVKAEADPQAGETVVVADVRVGGEKRRPTRPQPKTLLPPVSYFLSDWLLPGIVRPLYRRGKRTGAQPGNLA